MPMNWKISLQSRKRPPSPLKLSKSRLRKPLKSRLRRLKLRSQQQQKRRRRRLSLWKKFQLMLKSLPRRPRLIPLLPLKRMSSLRVSLISRSKRLKGRRTRDVENSGIK